MASSATQIGAIGPDVYWLPDEDGRLRRFLNFKYEDFQQAMQAVMDRRGAESLPAYRVDSVLIEATEDSAGVSCRIVVDVTLNSDGWISAELGFESLILAGTAVISGDDDLQYVQYQSTPAAFVARLRGKAGDQRRIELSGYWLETPEQGRKSLLFNGPVAPTTLQLTVPYAAVDATTSEGNRLATRNPTEDTTLLSLVGLGGATKLSWQPRTAGQEQPILLDAEGVVSVVLEPGVLHYDAVLTLRDPSSPWERLLVRLPPGASLVQSNEAADYQTSVVSDPSQQAIELSDGRQLVEVRWQRSDSNPATIRIVADQVVDDLREATSTSVGAFEVQGALRQRGFLTMRVSRNLHSFYDLDGPIQFVADESLPAAAEPNADAGFAYFSPDYTVQVHTQPRVRNVRVRPRHTLEVFSTHTELTSEFEYQITGGRTSDLRVALNGWTLTDEPIDSQEDVDLTEMHVTRNAQLILPLKNPDAQQVRVSFSLRRDTSLGLNRLSLPLALFAHTLPGAVTLRSDDSVEVRPDIEASTGLGSFSNVPPETQSTSSDGAIGRRRDARESVSLQTFLNDPTLAIYVAERDRPVRVESTITVEVRTADVAVLQSFALDADGSIPTSLDFALPSELVELWRSGSLEVSYDGRDLGPSEASLHVDNVQPGEVDGGKRTLSISPQTPLREGTAIQLSYRLDRNRASSEGGEDELFRTPVARATDGEQTTRAVVRTSPDVAVRIAGGLENDAWQLEPQVSESESMGWLAAGLADELPLALSSASESDAVLIQRAWAQTWLSDGVRQDRFVFRVDVEGDGVQLTLPKAWGPQAIETLLDGVAVELKRQSSGAYLLELPRSLGRSKHTIELRRQTRQRLGAWRTVSLHWPEIKSKGVSRLVYWQVVTPGNYVLWATSAGLFGEHQTGWNGMHWGRRPVMDQAQLENWSLAGQSASPPASANEYLYSTFGVPVVCEAKVVRSAWVGVVASTACFLLIMGAGRRLGRIAAFWVLASTAALATFLLRPELAVLMFQILLSGGVLWIIASLLRRLLLDRAEEAPRYALPTDSTAEYDAPTQLLIEGQAPSTQVRAEELSGSVSAGGSP